MMINRNNTRTVCAVLLFAILFSSCRDTVTITRSYIYNTSWENGEYQGFRIAKIKLNNATVSVFDKDFNRYSLDEHVIDSASCYGAGINGEATNKMSKIYFDKKSIYYLWYRCWSVDERYETIGLLDLDSWYIITGLRGSEVFYTYIDNEGNAYSYSLGPVNW